MLLTLSVFIAQLSVSETFSRKLEATLTQPLAMLQSLNDTSTSGTGACWVARVSKGGWGWNGLRWMYLAHDRWRIKMSLPHSVFSDITCNSLKLDKAGCLCPRNGHTLYIYSFLPSFEVYLCTGSVMANIWLPPWQDLDSPRRQISVRIWHGVSVSGLLRWEDSH